MPDAIGKKQRTQSDAAKSTTALRITINKVEHFQEPPTNTIEDLAGIVVL